MKFVARVAKCFKNCMGILIFTLILFILFALSVFTVFPKQVLKSRDRPSGSSVFTLKSASPVSKGFNGVQHWFRRGRNRQDPQTPFLSWLRQGMAFSGKFAHLNKDYARRILNQKKSPPARPPPPLRFHCVSALF